MVILLSRLPRRIASCIGLFAALALSGPPTWARTVPSDETEAAEAPDAGRVVGRHDRQGFVRMAEPRDRTIDYRGTYWGDTIGTAPPSPRAKSRNPLVNFIPDPDGHRFDEWSQQTYFDRAKRLAPTGDEPGIREKPAITFMKLRF
jgi:hypothetical protein